MKKLNPLFSVIFALVFTACGDPEPSDDSYSIELNAETDEGRPLSGVQFSSGKNDMGVSPESGSFSLRLRGAEGTTLPIEATCPKDYDSPAPGSVRLARVKSLSGEAESPLTYRAVCTRKLRDVIFVIHAENGANLPISIDGAAQGTTDEKGNAHVLVSVDRHLESLTLSLDTSEQPLLRPQNPRRVFELKGNDAIALFNQPLTTVRPKAPRQPAKAQRPHRPIPYRLK